MKKYVLFEKISSSPTLIISFEKKIYKVWPNIKDIEKQIQGVQYEKKVYKDVIYPMIKENDKLPFLNCLGVDDESLTLEKLENYFDVNDLTLRLCFFVIICMAKDPKIKNRVAEKVRIDWSKEFFKKFFNIYPELYKIFLQEKNKNFKLESIVLPEIKYKNLETFLKDARDEKIIFKLFLTLTKGLFVLYKKGIIHQDLHGENIMTVEIKGEIKPLIYDWDRAYIKGIKNDYLSNLPCDKTTLCYFSQCNIFFKKRPTDFIKLLHTFYINLQDKKLLHLVFKTLKIKDEVLFGKTLEKYGIHFTGKKCSVLYKKGYIKDFEKNVINNIGNWTDIARKLKLS